MTAKVNISDVWKSVDTIKCNIGGVWKTVDHGFIRHEDGSWKRFWGSGSAPPATLSLSQQLSIVSGSRSDAGAVTSSAATALVSGGTGPYTYAWTKVSGSTFTVNSPTANATTFSTTLTNGQELSAVYRCTVTDSLAATAFADVTVNLTSTYVAPPPPPPPPPSLTVVGTPSEVLGSRSQALPAGPATTGSISVSVSGGNGEYTYLWDSPVAAYCVPNQPNSPSCNFTKYINPGSNVLCYVNVYVTDSSGLTGAVTCYARFRSDGGV
jgi:hypothetical protein